MEMPFVDRRADHGACPLTEISPGPDAARFADIAFESRAVLFDGRRGAAIEELALNAAQPDDLVIDVEWSGISTGTEKLLWTGEMPAFPGLGYPLVPGYEAVGRVVWAGDQPALVGQRVFAPGANCFQKARGLFGASASRLVVPAERAAPIDFAEPQDAVMLALAATAHHAIVGGEPPDLIVGHGALGRLLARIAIARGANPPNVWEINPERADGDAYPVIDPDCDGRADYGSIYDASGDARVLDQLIAHLRPRGEITLAGFYADRPSFSFPAAFMKEARLRIAAEWTRGDLDSVLDLVDRGALSLSGLVTHRRDARDAESAYRSAFEDPACLKMVLDWRSAHGAA